MKVFASTNLSELITKKHVFVDTCLLFDLCIIKNENFKRKAIADLLSKDIVLVTTSPVKTEFLLGSDYSDLVKKQKYLASLIKAEIPVRVVEDKFGPLIEQYGKYARGEVSYVDLSLGAAVKHFLNTLLVTRNYNDFPLKIFDCVGIWALHLEKEIRTYCFYSDKTQKKDVSDLPF